MRRLQENIEVEFIQTPYVWKRRIQEDPTLPKFINPPLLRFKTCIGAARWHAAQISDWCKTGRSDELHAVACLAYVLAGIAGTQPDTEMGWRCRTSIIDRDFLRRDPEPDVYMDIFRDSERDQYVGSLMAFKPGYPASIVVYRESLFETMAVLDNYYSIWEAGQMPPRMDCQNCESRDGLVHDSRTAYHWDLYERDPNLPTILCEVCAKEYLEFWDEQWNEYYASQR